MTDYQVNLSSRAKTTMPASIHGEGEIEVLHII